MAGSLLAPFYGDEPAVGITDSSLVAFQPTTGASVTGGFWADPARRRISPPCRRRCQLRWAGSELPNTFFASCRACLSSFNASELISARPFGLSLTTFTRASFSCSPPE